MSSQTSQSEMKHTPDNHWPCACVKRDSAGNLSHIRLNAPTLARCSVCECTKSDVERLGREERAKACVASMKGIPDPSAHTESVKRLVEAAKAFCSDVANAPDTMTFSAQAIAMVNRNVDAFQSALTAYQQSVGGSNA